MDNGSENYRRFCENADEIGLVEIIREYKYGFIFFINSYVGNIQTAEDLAEDTFVLLGTKKPKDKGKGS
ncbi:MAG: RNA polymerase subunit sigma-24, partial [Clostridia bacterium]|nr:RNA polymerase subunit sigma-24 [Clostridia bacterium]